MPGACFGIGVYVCGAVIGEAGPAYTGTLRDEGLYTLWQSAAQHTARYDAGRSTTRLQGGRMNEFCVFLRAEDGAVFTYLVLAHNALEARQFALYVYQGYEVVLVC